MGVHTKCSLGNSSAVEVADARGPQPRISVLQYNIFCISSVQRVVILRCFVTVL